jgi:hypothetical protein
LRPETGLVARFLANGKTADGRKMQGLTCSFFSKFNIKTSVSSGFTANILQNAFTGAMIFK